MTRYALLATAVLAVAVAGCGSTQTLTKTVTQTVTKPSSPARASLPVGFVQGETEALAVKALKREGLSVRVVRRAHSGVPAGVVYAQNPAAGNGVREGTPVTIFVALASPSAPSDYFYSPSGNIECRFHQSAGFLNCITFDNHRIAQLNRDGTFAAFNGFLSNGPFAPGHTPVLAYGSRWANGPFACLSASAGMTCFTSATGHGFTIDRKAIGAYPKPAAPPAPPPPPATPKATSSQPQYVLANDVQQAITENGVDDSAGHEQVLTITCTGTGYAGPQKPDQFGVPESTYHIFSCFFTTATVQFAQMRVDTYAGNASDAFTYRYTISG